jgi:hypothetical protein
MSIGVHTIVNANCDHCDCELEIVGYINQYELMGRDGDV